MKPDTIELYVKYKYFMHLLDNNRHELFYINEDSLDYQKFFENYNMIISYHWLIKPPWRNFKKRRSEIIKHFEYGKYDIIITKYFCNDVKNLILTFIF